MAVDANNLWDPAKKPPLRPIVSHSSGVDEGNPRVEHTLIANVRALKFGDVVLIAGTKPPFSALTRAYQTPHVFHADYRQWTHVGLYIGNEMLLDKSINPLSPWRLRSFYDFCGQCDVLVRRSRLPVDLDSDFEIQARMLNEAIQHLKRPYAYLKAVGFGLRSIAGALQRNVRESFRAIGWNVFPLREREEWIGQDGMLCTDLIDICHRAGLRQFLVPREHWKTVEYMLTPAALSWTPTLRDIAIGHMDIVSAVPNRN